ncbi:hypothetical protein TIFTF001_025103 [Ficus carica]|uniref:Uncharacterized protein n=1 Tax=Ficus carica TaxID=3494 RepID=A0AA88AQR7_FICCA|nr:hypothetical protein TIFTF001_025103 [Ficus carica]
MIGIEVDWHLRRHRRDGDYGRDRTCSDVLRSEPWRSEQSSQSSAKEVVLISVVKGLSITPLEFVAGLGTGTMTTVAQIAVAVAGTVSEW